MALFNGLIDVGWEAVLIIGAVLAFLLRRVFGKYGVHIGIAIVVLAFLMSRTGASPSSLLNGTGDSSMAASVVLMLLLFGVVAILSSLHNAYLRQQAAELKRLNVERKEEGKKPLTRLPPSNPPRRRPAPRSAPRRRR